MGNMHIYLRANEKVFINGAVLKVDRKVSVELLNDATFLLENHVLQKEDVTTPLNQLYFVVQIMLINPSNTEQTMELFKEMVNGMLATLSNRELIEGVKQVDIEVSSGKPYPALKIIRELYPIEDQILDGSSTMLSPEMMPSDEIETRQPRIAKES